MRRTVLAIAVCCSCASFVSAQDVGMPGVMYSGSIAAGTGGQLFPFDRQDPWLHGHFQRMPAYGGFSSFRPYNYRHVFAQRQIATSVWGSAHGLPYSQQFWNRYRTDYLNGNIHSQAAVNPPGPAAVNPVSYQVQPSAAVRTVPAAPPRQPAAAGGRPIHVFPSGVPVR